MGHRVYVVVDRAFGEKLTLLARGTPVWIVDTSANGKVAKRLWAGTQEHDHLRGVTTFPDVPSSSAEELFLMELDTIDLHHGAHSSDPPYSSLEVIGTPLTERVKVTLGDYGFTECAETDRGFMASRSQQHVGG
jgi:hypothetical protein